MSFWKGKTPPVSPPPEGLRPLVSVASGMSGVGCATLSAHLAGWLSREGKETLLIDLAGGGQLPARLGGPQTPDLGELLAWGRELSEEDQPLRAHLHKLEWSAFQPEAWPGLLITGCDPFKLGELDPARLQRAIEEIRQRFIVVVNLGRVGPQVGRDALNRPILEQANLRCWVNIPDRLGARLTKRVACELYPAGSQQEEVGVMNRMLEADQVFQLRHARPLFSWVPKVLTVREDRPALHSAEKRAKLSNSKSLWKVCERLGELLLVLPRDPAPEWEDRRRSTRLQTLSERVEIRAGDCELELVETSAGELVLPLTSSQKEGSLRLEQSEGWLSLRGEAGREELLEILELAAPHVLAGWPVEVRRAEEILPLTGGRLDGALPGEERVFRLTSGPDGLVRLEDSDPEAILS